MPVEIGEKIIFTLDDPTTKGWGNVSWLKGKLLDYSFFPDSIEPKSRVQVLKPSETSFKVGEEITLGPRVGLIAVRQANYPEDLCPDPETEDWIRNIGNEFYWLALFNRIDRWIESLGSEV